MLGAHLAPLSESSYLIPAEFKSSKVYTQAYRALENAIKPLIHIMLRDKDDCKTCHFIPSPTKSRDLSQRLLRNRTHPRQGTGPLL
jgi:hypothetical protein